MQTPQFDAPVTLWKLGVGHLDVARSMRQEGEWILGEAINHVINSPMEEQWRFEIVSENQAIDHHLALRLAKTAIFRSWEFRCSDG